MRRHRDPDLHIECASPIDALIPSLSGLTLGLGVENLSDEQPPIFPSWQQANTDPSQYDVLGRRYYVDLRYRF